MKIKSTIIVLIILFLLSCANQQRHRLRLQIDSDPPGASVYEKRGDEPELRFGYKVEYGYEIKINDEDIKKGKIEIPTLEIVKSGYKSAIVQPGAISLDKIFWQNLTYIEGIPVHYYKLKDTIRLEKDPTYEGPRQKNRISLTINSEPQGARVYENGKFLGQTPFAVQYEIENSSYRAGVLRCVPLIAVHDACLPAKQELELQIDPEWRYESDQTHEYATLFLLKRDPDYRPPTIVHQEGGVSGGGESTVNLNLKQQKDALDVLQQAGSIIGIFQSLKPLR